ncbi:polysaccharide biosynthesis/export family protein [Ectothiorhodospira shaposhnikovii]|uniref:polysaccharide biosynthesis/export family protein n=1 Tax=Ectothiorhodospira shaposhnikovii TaxID=1054 RepID=UPI001EE7CCB0|nr:polysaccharide biosynthesis/export family protein [Ectothiorhodospira shaposhnikovii]MCG5514352.1 polysaccharide biosynthesis/export family protein [Ectothiorhodospira shaposhnikovii]
MLLTMLSGCTLVPGMTMPTPGQLLHSAGPDGVYETNNGLLVEVIPITTTLTETRRDTPPRAALSNLPLATVDALRGDYHIAPRDELEITTWGHEQLMLIEREQQPRHVVAADGTIFFPFIGRVEVAGLSAKDAQGLITRKLSRVFESPQVDVRIVSFRGRPVRVMGEVNTPGQVFIADQPLTVMDAIHQAGGPTEDADLRRVLVSRNGGNFQVDLLSTLELAELFNSLVLQESDLVYVPDNSGSRVYVLGEVSRTTGLTLPRAGLTLTQALAESSGLNPSTARAGSVYVLRGSSERPQVYYLDLRRADGLLLGDRFALAERDVIFVDAAPITRWNRFINQLLPTLVILRETDRGPINLGSN